MWGALRRTATKRGGMRQPVAALLTLATDKHTFRNQLVLLRVGGRVNPALTARTGWAGLTLS